MTILYKFASRSRPENFFKGVENIYINSRLNDYSILATLDTDDLTMNNPDVIERMKRYDKLYPIFGKSESKIHAINRDMKQAPDFELLIVMSDDMLFIEPGFDGIIVSDMKENFPEGCGVLHYSDGNRSDIITMSIMDKKYYDMFGYIYYPEYQTWYADNEFTDTAKRNNKYKFINRKLFRHNHYQWRNQQPDELYKKNDQMNLIVQDKNLYYSRCGY